MYWRKKQSTKADKHVRKVKEYIDIFWYLFLYMNAKYINHITKWMASRVLNYGHK